MRVLQHFITCFFVSFAGGHNKNYAKKEKEKKEKDEKKEKKLGRNPQEIHVFIHVWYYLPTFTINSSQMKLASNYNILFPLRIRLYVGLGSWNCTQD